MDNQKHCHLCGTANTADSRFCRECGSRFLDEAARQDPLSRLRNDIHTLVEQKTVELNGLAARLQDQIELNSRNRIEDWLRKGSIGVFLFVGLSAGFGIYSFKDAMGTLQKTEEQIKIQMQATREKFDAIDSNLVEMQAAFEQSKHVLEEKNKQVSSLASDVESKSDEAKFALAEIQELKASTARQVDAIRKQVNRLLENVRHVENATFDVFINHSSTEANRDDFTNALAELKRMGFRISNSNVAKIDVNQSEVIYYSELNSEKAEEIVNALKSYFPGLAKRLLKNNDRGMRELLIKLDDGRYSPLPAP